jgi:hypothetical protein
MAKVGMTQKLDTMYFNLYVDSLKKGTYNYINVEGKFSNGNYLPLTAEEVEFSCDSAKFDRNSLFIDSNFAPRFVNVVAVYKKDRSKKATIKIPIKQWVVQEKLKTEEEVIGTPARKRRG